ncbi:MAG: hypothetical protein M5U33_02245 [Pseudorhodoplanes sp.]|nr:hypothetical protein [Pseudorhodoplanes sp.]
MTSVPSSPISTLRGPVTAFTRRSMPPASVSKAASLRPSSATWRARSAVPRDRSAIWSPTSLRSRMRVATVL